MEYDERLHEFVVVGAECGRLLDDDCHSSLLILLHLMLIQLLPGKGSIGFKVCHAFF